jgi:hypothetical protein
VRILYKILFLEVFQENLEWSDDESIYVSGRKAGREHSNSDITATGILFVLYVKMLSESGVSILR